MRRKYIIIKKSKKILQKQVGLYYHSIIFLMMNYQEIQNRNQDFVVENHSSKSRLMYSISEIFTKSCWQFYRVCYNLFTNRTFVLCGLVFFIFEKVRSGLSECWSWKCEKKSSFFRLSKSCLRLQTDIVCTQLWNKKPVLSRFVAKRNWFWWSGFCFDLSEMQTENRCCLL